MRRVYYGWWVVAAASGMSFANAATAISILTVLVVPMSQEFGWNRTEVAGATSLGAVLGAGLAPFTGRAVDRFGARVTLVAGGLIVVAGCLYLSVAQALAGFYVAFTAIRIADQGLIQVSASVTAGKWFVRYRGRAEGTGHAGQFRRRDRDGAPGAAGDLSMGLASGVGHAGGSDAGGRHDSGAAAGPATTGGSGIGNRRECSLGAGRPELSADEPQIRLGTIIRTPSKML